MKSAIYEGVVRHRRTRPTEHRLELRVAMPYLDLDELETLFDDDRRFAVGRPALARFDRRDHHGQAYPSLAEATRALVENRLGFRPDGPVRLLTHLRYLGYGFNPVSFFYCFDRAERLLAIVSEVNNTPWGERHCYVHDARTMRGDELVHTFDKSFHVSPFMAMEQRYEWRFGVPGEALSVRMTNLDDEGAIFHASMQLARRPWTRASRSRLLFRYPLLTAQVVTAIYAHAAILHLRGVPYVPHPDDHRRRGEQLRASAAGAATAPIRSHEPMPTPKSPNPTRHSYAEGARP